jgi:hypothetical protein
MKVLLAGGRQGRRDSLRRLIQRDPEVQVSGIAEDAENAPVSVIARELRRTWMAALSTTVYDGGYRDHSFVILATVAIEPQWQSAPLVKQYYDFLDERRWQELLRLREWNDALDTLIGFAFRCAAGRVGIVTMLSSARPGLPDTPLHCLILPEEEGNSLLALIPAEKWHPLRSTSAAPP